VNNDDGSKIERFSVLHIALDKIDDEKIGYAAGNSILKSAQRNHLSFKTKRLDELVHDCDISYSGQ
jgi:hypothetical protein